MSDLATFSADRSYSDLHFFFHFFFSLQQLIKRKKKKETNHKSANLLTIQAWNFMIPSQAVMSLAFKPNAAKIERVEQLFSLVGHLSAVQHHHASEIHGKIAQAACDEIDLCINTNNKNFEAKASPKTLS